MRKSLALLAGLLVLALTSTTIYRKELLLRDGRVLLLELAPVDPRALMQGDYMALRFAAADAVRSSKRRDGYLVLRVDPRNIGRDAHVDHGMRLRPDQLRLRYRVRHGRVQLVTNAFFFGEGDAAHYAGARYGEFRVGADGEALLTALRGPALEVLGPAR